MGRGLHEKKLNGFPGVRQATSIAASWDISVATWGPLCIPPPGVSEASSNFLGLPGTALGFL